MNRPLVQCTKCPLKFFYVKTKATGSSMPIDPLPNPEGNVTIDEDGLAEVHGDLLKTLIPPELLWQSHFPTCEKWQREHASDLVASDHLARNDDPSTSHKGAHDVVPRARSQMALLLTSAFALHEDLSSEEAGIISGLAARRGCCYWHRVSDLAARGYIESTGSTRVASTGSEQAVYRITDKGRALVAAWGEA